MELVRIFAGSMQQKLGSIAVRRPIREGNKRGVDTYSGVETVTWLIYLAAGWPLLAVMTAIVIGRLGILK